MRVPASKVARARQLRRTMSLPEVLLWQGLRDNGLRLRRQHPVGAYVLDFYAPEARLAVEVDGAAHDHPDAVRRDAGRDAWLDAQGIRVLRINAAEVLDTARRGDVLATIAVLLGKTG